MTIWNEQTTALLTELWPNNTALEIARRIPGSTRSGVIGKASRMKLEKNPDASNYNRPPAKERIRHIGTVTTRSRKRTRPDDTKQIDITSYASDGAKSLADIQSRECHWPVSSEGRNHMLCAATIEGRSSYCERHNSIAYQGGNPGKSVTKTNQWEGMVK